MNPFRVLFILVRPIFAHVFQHARRRCPLAAGVYERQQYLRALVRTPRRLATGTNGAVRTLRGDGAHTQRTTSESLRVVVHSRRGSSNARDICAYQIKHARGRCAHAAGTYTSPEKLSGLVPPRAGTVLDLAKLVRLRAIPTLVEFNTRAHHAPPAGGLGYHPETNARLGTRSMYTMYNYSCACAPL